MGTRQAQVLKRSLRICRGGKLGRAERLQPSLELQWKLKIEFGLNWLTAAAAATAFETLKEADQIDAGAGADGSRGCRNSSGDQIRREPSTVRL
ncbi:hypothetical protein VM1G_11558 [Cytospora mali]|uniref:Uncharacterized protein n=1 Tax=Cytospora mali TaxID=578113 RepID=A0A194VX37_CYTMA|nr:hypothetical protein VM1G_11558 [Valsa mali]